jgi:hypothetical protein
MKTKKEAGEFLDNMPEQMNDPEHSRGINFRDNKLVNNGRTRLYLNGGHGKNKTYGTFSSGQGWSDQGETTLTRKEAEEFVWENRKDINVRMAELQAEYDRGG